MDPAGQGYIYVGNSPANVSDPNGLCSAWICYPDSLHPENPPDCWCAETDLARAGWELHAIATFAGHRSLATTLQYIHLSGRDLANKLAHGMAEVHAWRVEQLSELPLGGTTC